MSNKANTARHSNATSQTTIDTKKKNKSLSDEICVVEEGDNPSQAKQRLKRLQDEIMFRRAFIRKYGLTQSGYDALAMILFRYEMEGIGSTLFWLKGIHGMDTSIDAARDRLMRLVNRGLLEIVGLSNKNGRIHIPTRLALQEFGVSDLMATA